MAEIADYSAAALSDVSHCYKRTEALKSVSLAMDPGSITGLIGPDGVGKSTLLALLAGAKRIQAGKIIVLGGDMADRHHRRAVCSRIAYMPQGLGKNLYSDLTVAENIDFFGRLFGLRANERMARMLELLNGTGLGPFRDRRAGKLSGGMKQKLGLCCALIHDPDLLILDEPTTGIDPLSRRQFWQLVARFRAQRPGMTVVVATAYMEEAEAFDRIVMMDEGRILATGTPSELKERTGAPALEGVYVALLPEVKRRAHRAFTIAPLEGRDEVAAIEAEGLTRRFGDFSAVDNVSFRIGRGEIFGFLGPNGCGKTTTMRMLTGLVAPSEGAARLFGHELDPGDRDTRKRIGYMSQGFSLYSELTVRQNLVLHGQIYGLSADLIARRIAQLVERLGLADMLDERAEKLPLGLRQRLSLAVAVIHEPQILILDEPTSGVDPIARDQFWEFLAELSREHGVTIFVSTHYLNEAERCDRISFMNAGRVLACDRPAALIASSGARNLEEAFITFLEKEYATATASSGAAVPAATRPASLRHEGGADGWGTALQRMWAYARREMLELSRDPIRLAFATLAPILLLLILGYGISFDVNHLTFAALDRDQTPESRAYLEEFRGSPYFVEQGPLVSYADMDARLQGGTLKLAIEIRDGFGRDLRAGRSPAVGFWVDGGMPFRGETIRGYVQALHLQWEERFVREHGLPAPVMPAGLEVRYRYNQSVTSVFSMLPGNIAILLALIPTMLTAVAVVREKELGSITNVFVTPVRRAEFLLGKQLIYVTVSFAIFVALVAVTIGHFDVRLKGSAAALALGAVFYLFATTGIGLLISTLTRSQIGALLGGVVVTIIPAVQFSGQIRPVSSMTGGAAVMGSGFPATYFRQISVGTFTKALDLTDLWLNHLVLALFAAGIFAAALLLTGKQET
ncbi:ribosome-associated ATPase/putative transporter RbbA [Bradyrhizobium sp.]|uniref:ribosome-associated ATPase/putative transporter RbbA n=1 Tax=Bradyrhizobium sp. TaxID=376 RepID=UPI0025C38372|nr:ribosome-associated ATPase/putative transporter RbbA [Bradyrhizobium sp.]